MQIAPAKKIFMAELVVIGGIELVECAAVGSVLRVPGAGRVFVLAGDIQLSAQHADASAQAYKPGARAMGGGSYLALLHRGFNAVLQTQAGWTLQPEAERVVGDLIRTQVSIAPREPPGRFWSWCSR